jgi:hypothetical protein
MTQRLRLVVVTPLFLVLLASGCVVVTEPLSDIAKAEPDKRLLGKWQPTKSYPSLEIDIPAVKGNPKGLMRAVQHPWEPDAWFFTTTIGKHTYATLCCDQNKERDVYVDFSKEGAFEKWNKGSR